MIRRAFWSQVNSSALDLVSIDLQVPLRKVI